MVSHLDRHDSIKIIDTVLSIQTWWVGVHATLPYIVILIIVLTGHRSSCLKPFLSASTNSWELPRHNVGKGKWNRESEFKFIAKQKYKPLSMYITYFDVATKAHDHLVWAIFREELSSRIYTFQGVHSRCTRFDAMSLTNCMTSYTEFYQRRQCQTLWWFCGQASLSHQEPVSGNYSTQSATWDARETAIFLLLSLPFTMYAMVWLICFHNSSSIVSIRWIELKIEANIT